MIKTIQCKRNIYILYELFFCFSFFFFLEGGGGLLTLK